MCACTSVCARVHFPCVCASMCVCGSISLRWWGHFPPVVCPCVSLCVSMLCYLYMFFPTFSLCMHLKLCLRVHFIWLCACVFLPCVSVRIFSNCACVRFGASPGRQAHNSNVTPSRSESICLCVSCSVRPGPFVSLGFLSLTCLILLPLPRCVRRSVCALHLSFNYYIGACIQLDARFFYFEKHVSGRNNNNNDMYQHST